jgi:hypothetical protein
VKTLVWFWLIDKTYVLTFVMSGDMSKVGTFQVVELEDDHAWCMMMTKRWLSAQLEKEEREK